MLEKALKTDHAPAASTPLSLTKVYWGLANGYLAQGRYAEVETLFKRAVAVCEEKLGPVHLYAAATQNNLAILYHQQGRYAEAENLYLRGVS